jgi:hypothetical protein
MLTWLGRSEGFVAVAVVIFACMVALVATGTLTGDQFNYGLTVLLGSLYGGGAAKQFGSAMKIRAAKK